MTTEHAATVSAQNLLVIYTEQLEACRDFYSGIGLTLVGEQHGNGPVHYAAEIPAGMVSSSTPASPDEPPAGCVSGSPWPAATCRSVITRSPTPMAEQWSSQAHTPIRLRSNEARRAEITRSRRRW
jgi:hypothetical protein